MDLPVIGVPGMDGILRQRDLPGPCRVEDINDPGFQALKTYAQATTQAAGFMHPQHISGFGGPDSRPNPKPHSEFVHNRASPHPSESPDWSVQSQFYLIIQAVYGRKTPAAWHGWIPNPQAQSCTLALEALQH